MKLQKGIDAYEFLESLSSADWKKIDTIIFDPPYYSSSYQEIGRFSKTISNTRMKFDHKMNMSKTHRENIEQYILSHIHKDAIWFKFHTDIRKLNLNNNFIIWHKSNVPFNALNGNTEFIETNAKLLFNKKYRILSLPLIYYTRPAAKPIGIFMELYALADSHTVLDPFAGYGNSIVAAIMQDIDIYACDIDTTLNWNFNKKNISDYF